jgi:hypothetical protein
MHKKRYVLVLIPLAAVWLYAVGQSAGRMFALIDEAPRAIVERPPAATPDWAHEPTAPQSDGVAAAPPVVPAAEQRSAVEPWSPPPPVYAEPSYSQAPSVEPIEHPEVTDPHMRRLLQPAWDD